MVSVPCKEAIEVMLEVYEPFHVESTPLSGLLSCGGNRGGRLVKGLIMFLG